MEPVNKSGKRRRGRRKNSARSPGSPPDGRMFPAVGIPEQLEERQGLSALHVACLYGHLARVQLILESRPGWEWMDRGDLQGRRPVHMVLSSRSSPNTFACLTYMVERGADVNATTDSGTTPLHLAASEGLLDCTETLTQAGADVSVRDCMGHTALDLARIWCRRKVARYLKSCMWQTGKKKEMQERKLVHTLYSDLVDAVKLIDLDKKPLVDKKTAEWANKKGLPPLKDFSPSVLVSQYHTKCLSSVQGSPHPKQPLKQQSEGPLQDQSTSAERPPASPSRPWTIFMGLQPEEPLREPDLRDKVSVWRDSGGSMQPHYTTQWDSTHRPAPDVSLDVLERVLFPRAFPSRIASLRSFEPQDIVEVQHRGYPQGRSTSPWTEVAMHLAEVLEPGHY
ncbi:ankyrin repeat domain-containing protein 53 [Cyclopterus lumpus]|uniref:ankyrin repeat domain-containing protein 53 n=1 Tax=Cyclopterus lumpus TaxID=8103 RepID=UPI001486F88A|nr:ankyrin repeat domain-containing protein 53 [Cyclopterus lumpus]